MNSLATCKTGLRKQVAEIIAFKLFGSRKFKSYVCFLILTSEHATEFNCQFLIVLLLLLLFLFVFILKGLIVYIEGLCERLPEYNA